MNNPEIYGIGAIAVSVIGILFWVVKWMAGVGRELIQELSKSIKANTDVTNENLEYLKHKNGQMEECFTRVMDNQAHFAKQLDEIEKRGN